MDREIGGFFELELNHGEDYHAGAVRLNSGRNALRFILESSRYTKVYVPDYLCSSVLEPLRSLAIPYEFYSVNRQLEPIFDSKLTAGEGILYVNYFGVCDHVVKRLATCHQNLIIDNAQSFFSYPLENVDTYYSPRKFFGVPDGGYAYSRSELRVDVPNQDESFARCEHLLERLDKGSRQAYPIFLKNEARFSTLPMLTMSGLTRNLLENIDYLKVKRNRLKNFMYLHDHLQSSNELHINFDHDSVPMVYPFLYKKHGLREHLVQNGVFVAQYWKDVFSWAAPPTDASYLANYLLALPMDQRYSIDHMKEIVKLIEVYNK